MSDQPARYFLFPRYREMVFWVGGVSKELAHKSRGSLARFFEEELPALPYGVVEIWTQRRETEVVVKFDPVLVTTVTVKAFLAELGIKVGGVRVRRRGIVKWAAWDIALFGFFVIGFALVRIISSVLFAAFDLFLADGWLDLLFWALQLFVLGALSWGTASERDYNAPLIAALAFAASIMVFGPMR